MTTKKKERQLLAETNKAFSRMSKADKRVTLAKDVILQLKVAMIHAEQGTYLKSDNLYQKLGNDEVQKSDELCDVLPSVVCSVCAKGALFIADVMRRDKLKVSDFDNYTIHDSIVKRLNEIFTSDQLDLIETAFENNVITDWNPILRTVEYDDLWDTTTYTDTPLAKKAIRFGKRYKDETRCMIGIMNNIIKNKGEFIP